MFYVKFHVDADENYCVYSIRSWQDNTEFLLRINDEWSWVDARNCIPLK
jgi:hypothetical protein